MSPSSSSVFLFLLLIVLPSPALSSLSLDYSLRYPSSCDASSPNCHLSSPILLHPEPNRRILAGIVNYISYGSLSANRVPCSSAGRSYYGCPTSGPVNPYTRSCSKITRCGRDTG